jgi:uncharacterized protein with GYD domain
VESGILGHPGKEATMAYFLVQVSYTPEAWAAVLNNPQDRSKAVEGAIHALGGRMESFWMSFGDHDFVGVVDMPTSVSAAAFSMALAAGGACRNVKTTALLTISEAQDAMKQAATCGYTPVTKAAAA